MSASSDSSYSDYEEPSFAEWAKTAFDLDNFPDPHDLYPLEKLNIFSESDFIQFWREQTQLEIRKFSSFTPPTKTPTPVVPYPLVPSWLSSLFSFGNCPGCQSTIYVKWGVTEFQGTHWHTACLPVPVQVQELRTQVEILLQKNRELEKLQIDTKTEHDQIFGLLQEELTRMKIQIQKQEIQIQELSHPNQTMLVKSTFIFPNVKLPKKFF